MSQSRASYHHGDLEAALLATARSLVEENGVEAVSLRQIAATLGVSPSAVYHHFPDKSALLAALAGIVHQELGEAVSGASQSAQGTGAVAAKVRLKAIGQAYFDFANAHQNLFRLAFGPYCPKRADGQQESLAFTALTQTLAQLRQAGALTAESDEAAALIAWSSIHGAANLVIDGILPPEAVSALLDAVSAALTKAPNKALPRQSLLQRVSNDELDYDFQSGRNDRANEILRERPPHHF